MTQTPCMILAGGRSQRMGTDKALAALAGRPLIAHVIDRLAPQCAALAINVNGDTAPYVGFGLPLRSDTFPGQPGPLAGILCAMDWVAAEGAAHVMTAAADMPFLPRDLAPRLLELAGAGRIVVPRSETGLQPVCALWPVALADRLRDWIVSGRTGKVRAFLESNPHEVLDIPPQGPDTPDPFFNANTPEDLSHAARLIAGGRVAAGPSGAATS